MFADQRIMLALRKERLAVRAIQQRERLALYGGWLRKPCTVVDKIISAGRYANAHPWTVGVCVGVAALMGRRHLFRMAGYTWSAWRAWRFASAWARESTLITLFKNK